MGTARLPTFSVRIAEPRGGERAGTLALTGADGQ
jgi:hypothetical protein